MLNKLNVEDFEVLKKTLESGRQSPKTLGDTLLLTVVLQFLMFYVTYFISAESTIYPNVGRIQSIHLYVTAVLVLLSIIFSFPSIYKKMEKTQYLISVIVSQNLFGVFLYLCALFLVGEADGITEKSLLNFTYITFLFGVLIFIVTSIRFYILLKKGKYRKGSAGDELRAKFETKSYLPAVIIGSLGLVFILQYLFSRFQNGDIGMIFYIVLPFLIFYTMLFVLPEQLVILYCKFRFKSFNFNKRGYLES